MTILGVAGECLEACEGDETVSVNGPVEEVDVRETFVEISVFSKAFIEPQRHECVAAFGGTSDQDVG